MDAALSLPPDDAKPPAPPRTLRWIELLLLMAVAFGPSLYQAVVISVGALPFAPTTSSHRWVQSMVHQLTALGLCAYILHQQGRSFRELGLTARWYDAFAAVGIMLLGLLALLLTGLALHFGGLYTRAEMAVHSALNRDMLGRHLEAPFVVFLVVNACFEELIVRAYLLTDVRFLTGSAFLAVVVSSVFQGAYHLYQGWQAAVCATAGFLVFSVFYVAMRRITPLIFAHLLWDLFVTGLYFYLQAHPLRRH